LFKDEHLDFDAVFQLRHLSVAKYYRKWINEVGENSDQAAVTEEYLNAVKDDGNFFESKGDKFIKNLCSFGISTKLGMVVAGAMTGAPGPAVAIAAGVGTTYALGLLDTFVLEGVLKGENPSMFIDRVKFEATPAATLDNEHPQPPTVSGLK